jgi:ABC-type multidrug transport system fused ATPase/permease subunit
MIKGSPLAALRPRDAARWCALVCPEIGLLRTSLRRNLTVRRRTVHDGELRAALLLVGLDPDVWSLDRLVDPEIADPDLWTQARLRLARAIVHKPRIILIAEPTLAQDPFTPALLQRLSEATRAAIVCAYGGEETAGLAIWPAAA